MGLAAVTAPAQAADISGAGATFPYPLYAKWADTYKKETGNRPQLPVDRLRRRHQADQAKTVTFGASDAPLKADELDKHGLVQFPMVIGGVVPVVNLDGRRAGRARARRPDAGRHLPRQDQDLERPAPSRR